MYTTSSFYKMHICLVVACWELKPEVWNASVSGGFAVNDLFSSFSPCLFVFQFFS